MGSYAIETSQLGKRYQIGAKQAPYRTLRESIVNAASFPWRSLAGRPQHANRSSHIWALRDVTLEVPAGDVVGVIGHNGSGKTTLLRILSRITEPTSGTVRLRGRVGSLLEVGTGFHPELTGRENIYLSGAILGMTAADIRLRFDEIVAFADVDRHLDTAVKHYSSGMYLRLAFAVAAHLEPDILLVDEVLAVGDASFQKKCLGRMQQVARTGRSVLFVSHNLAAISHMCARCAWLHRGRLRMLDDTSNVLKRYLSTHEAASSTDLSDAADRPGSGKLRFTQISLANDAGQVVDTVAAGEAVSFRLRYRGDGVQSVQQVIVRATIRDEYGSLLFTLSPQFTEDRRLELPPQGTIVCHVPRLPLTQGSYSIGLFLSAAGELADEVTSARQLEVIQADAYHSGKLPNPRLYGPILVEHQWNVEASVS